MVLYEGKIVQKYEQISTKLIKYQWDRKFISTLVNSNQYVSYSFGTRVDESSFSHESPLKLLGYKYKGNLGTI